MIAGDGEKGAAESWRAAAAYASDAAASWRAVQVVIVAAAVVAAFRLGRRR